MAYVVARRGGRYEVRESFHTSKGPRARTLAGFGVLTEEILRAAARRAQRPFESKAVIGSARRAGARVQIPTSGANRARDRFLAGSMSMAGRLEQSPPAGARADPGTALLELLSFADMVAAAQPPRPPELLAFPTLAGLVKRRARDTVAQ
jgi:hypothetical protein